MNRDLSDYSVTELEAEIERRKERRLKFPSLLPDEEIQENFLNLKAYVVEYLRQIRDGVRIDEDHDYWLYEAVINTFYDSSVWDYIIRYESKE